MKRIGEHRGLTPRTVGRVSAIILALLAFPFAAPLALGVDITHEFETVSGGSGLREASVECPAGKKVLGGGAFTAYGSSVISSFPVDGSDNGAKADDRWAALFDANEPVEVSVSAACARPEATGALRYREQDFTVSAFEDKGETVSCGGKYQTTGGGWTNDGDAQVISSKPQGTGGWRGSFSGVAIDSPIVVFAICAKGKFANGLSYHVDRKTVKPGKDKGVSSPCTGDSEAVGGGGTTFALLAGTGIDEFDLTQTYIRSGSADPTPVTNYGICYR